MHLTEPEAARVERVIAALINAGIDADVAQTVVNDAWPMPEPDWVLQWQSPQQIPPYGGGVGVEIIRDDHWIRWEVTRYEEYGGPMPMEHVKGYGTSIDDVLTRCGGAVQCFRPRAVTQWIKAAKRVVTASPR